MEHLNIQIKRVYAQPALDDGKRILVDRLWPRGMTKAKAKVDFWLKDVAPSQSLRKWFDHDPLKWNEFKKRYLEELASRLDALTYLKEESVHGTVTLLYGAKDEEHNEAVVLLQLLQKNRTP
ncbi:DUF488 domain-containing protein [Terriglobus roseus]|uniref:Uncharacterized conserved protein YeaO, DUF488 family n=1 Tax=Terriglobus roseus TaxID=392734 RepID=A0A1G7GAL5_9BACT|nr:DUF488 domain-containing protein [Terriglobus roseus]SDE85115.1 Uncharacterized conserved protein YeaO, DUF488 family [Terriglobus roseus]